MCAECIMTWPREGLRQESSCSCDGSNQGVPIWESCKSPVVVSQEPRGRKTFAQSVALAQGARLQGRRARRAAVRWKGRALARRHRPTDDQGFCPGTKGVSHRAFALPLTTLRYESALQSQCTLPLTRQITSNPNFPTLDC